MEKKYQTSNFFVKFRVIIKNVIKNHVCVRFRPGGQLAEIAPVLGTGGKPSTGWHLPLSLSALVLFGVFVSSLSSLRCPFASPLVTLKNDIEVLEIEVSFLVLSLLLSALALPYLGFSCALSCRLWSCLFSFLSFVFSSLVLSCPVFSSGVLSSVLVSCTVLSSGVLSCLVLSCLALSCLAFSCLVFS